jgi:hypothetical protein
MKELKKFMKGEINTSHSQVQQPATERSCDSGDLGEALKSIRAKAGHAS